MKEFDLSDTKKYPIPLWEREWRAYEDNCLKEHKSELQVRTDALSAECRCYLAICNGLENPHLSDVGRNYLKTEQEKMMDVITKNIHLKAELGEFLRFRNATLKPQNGK